MAFYLGILGFFGLEGEGDFGGLYGVPQGVKEGGRFGQRGGGKGE